MPDEEERASARRLELRLRRRLLRCHGLSVSLRASAAYRSSCASLRAFIDRARGSSVMLAFEQLLPLEAAVTWLATPQSASKFEKFCARPQRVTLRNAVQSPKRPPAQHRRDAAAADQDRRQRPAKATSARQRAPPLQRWWLR